MVFEVVRWSMLSSTLMLAVFGYFDQLRLVLERESTAGLSFWMVLLSFWSWTSYALYGYFQKDHKMFWPNMIGVLFVSFILVNFLRY